MKKNLLFILLILSFKANSQKPSPPKWSDNLIEFKTAKFAAIDPKTNKRGQDTYKDATILISNPGEPGCMIGINIPDVYYIESAVCINYEYKSKPSGTIEVSFSGDDGDRMVYIGLVYLQFEDKPSFISVTWSDNITQKPLVTRSVILSEVKTF